MSLFEFEGIQLDPDRFVTEEAFEDCLEEQETIAQFAIEHYTMIGQEKGTELDVDFYFSTNTKEKAEIFLGEMAKRGFHGCLSTPRPPDNLYSVVLTKTKVAITENNLTILAREMCKIGYVFDCSFDSWGMGFFTESEGGS
jgi:hypothetical protein